ncbi:MAG: hypothetical protein J7M40_01315, partial [Planctomycetes bacterium]|nr:hypothetical protein [Planctomycetota bacterium]
NLGLAPHYSPFTAHHSLLYENEPNLHRSGPVEDQKTRNEPNPNPAYDPNAQNKPNFRTAGVSPAFSYPHFTKQTQFIRTAAIYNPQYTIYNPLPNPACHKSQLTSVQKRTYGKNAAIGRVGFIPPESFISVMTAVSPGRS